MRHGLAIVVLLMAAPALLTSCSDSGSGEAGPDTTPPSVYQVNIPDGATGVGLVEQLRVTFSEPIDPSTITPASILVEGRSVTGYVDYDAATRTASFTPDTLFADNTPLQLVVTTDVADDEGNALASEHVTSFTTGPFDEEHLRDHLEPNDDIAHASAVGLNEWVRTLTIYTGTDDYDSFQFTLNEAAKIRAVTAMRYSAENQTWSTQFRRLDGATYLSSSYDISTGDTKYIYYTLPAGTYVVDLHSWDPDPWTYALYDFMLETDEPCPDDPFEENDFLMDAVLIAANQEYQLAGCYADYDCFKVDLAEGQTMAVTLTAGSQSLRVLSLFDPDQLGITSVTGSEDPMSTSHTAEEPGLYYIMVRFYEDDIDYVMDVSVE